MLLTPLFLLGLLGLGLPWWLHRLETQATEREPFSTTRFMEASKKRIHVQRKLKYLLLMALRMLFLALLAFAFARPILLRDEVVVVSEDTTHHVIVLDTSFSMHYGDHFATARERAQTLIAGMGSDDIASLYTADTAVTTIVEPSADPQTLSQALPGLTPGNGRLDLGAMVLALNGLIEESRANFVLHLIGDFQLSGQAVRFADMVPDVINGHPVTLDLQQVDPEPRPNWTVDAVLVENRSRVIASVRAFNSPGASEKTVTLLVNGEQQQSQTLQTGTAPNGSWQVSFDAVTFSEGDNRVDIRLAPADALPEDDLRHAVFDNAPPAPVLLLTDDLDSLGVTYLRAALETAPRGYSVEAMDVADFDPRVIQRYPWLVIEDIGIVNAGLETALRNYLNNGGAMFAAAGPRAAGLATLPLLDSAVSVPPPTTDHTVPPPQITRIDTSHPTLNAGEGWSSVNARPVRLTLTDADRVLIAQTDNQPLLLERAIGTGRLMLLATSLDNSTSDLPVKPVFVSFMAEVAQYLSNEKLLVKEQVADSYLQLSQTGGASGQVVDPDGTTLLSLEDTTQAQDVQLQKTGYYQVFTPAGQVLVAVNPDIRESDLSLMPVSTLQSWQNIVAGTATTDTGALATPAGQENAADTIEVWRIFLILLGLMVLAESLLGNRYLNIKTGSF